MVRDPSFHQEPYFRISRIFYRRRRPWLSPGRTGQEADGKSHFSRQTQENGGSHPTRASRQIGSPIVRSAAAKSLKTERRLSCCLRGSRRPDIPASYRLLIELALEKDGYSQVQIDIPGSLKIGCAVTRHQIISYMLVCPRTSPCHSMPTGLSGITSNRQDESLVSYGCGW